MKKVTAKGGMRKMMRAMGGMGGPGGPMGGGGPFGGGMPPMRSRACRLRGYKTTAPAVVFFGAGRRCVLSVAAARAGFLGCRPAL